jgi:hypothetical protein
VKAKVSGWEAASLTFAASIWMVVAGMYVGPGCQSRCTTSFECGDGSFCSSGRCQTECFQDQDCREPEICQDNPTACKPLGILCNSVGRCVGRPDLDPNRGGTRTPPTTPLPTEAEGFAADPGTGGPALVVTKLEVGRFDEGFDLNNRCDAAGNCVDNSLAELGPVATDQLNNAVKSGATILLLELAGLDNSPYRGEDDSLTVKFYVGRDADEPSFSANNFFPTSSGGACCEFRIAPVSLAGLPAQATARAAAKIDPGGRLRSLVPAQLLFRIVLGTPPVISARFEKAFISGLVTASKGTANVLEDAMIGAAWPMAGLAEISGAFCTQQSQLCPGQVPPGSSLLDLFFNQFGIQPDVDLDGDGQECLFDRSVDGIVDTCCDKAGRTQDDCAPGSCATPILAPQPNISCAAAPAMADGYSVTFKASTVKARILGISQ